MTIFLIVDFFLYFHSIKRAWNKEENWLKIQPHCYQSRMWIVSRLVCVWSPFDAFIFQNSSKVQQWYCAVTTCELFNERSQTFGSFRARSSSSKVRFDTETQEENMIRQVLKRIAIRKRDYAPLSEIVRTSSSSTGKINLEVKINQQNETFELHDAEVSTVSGKQKKLEFPFVYLRDNCQVSFVISL